MDGLYQLGATVFQVSPLNVHEASRDRESDFAEKSVLGRRPPLEAVGPGAETRNFQGRLFPAKLGGLSRFEDLAKAQDAQAAQKLIRGDGENLGWYVITSLHETHTFIGPEGIGRVIDFDLTIKAADKPSSDQMQGQLAALLAT